MRKNIAYFPIYRKLLLLFLCGRTLTAPQQGIETIADVKPTIFDYPAEVYNLPAHYPDGDSLINVGRPYSSLYDMTTENIDLETTDYNEELTDGYDKITESIPRDYESKENTAEIYSNIGLFANNYLPGQRRLEIKKEGNVADVTYSEISNKTDFKTINSTKEKSSKIEGINTEVKPTAVDKKLSDKSKTDEVATNFSDSKNILNNNQNFGSTVNIKNIANIVEDVPNYETSKPSYFSNGRKSYLNENFIKKGRRKFRTNCRCEKIWNCPKLQITVPRCPDEYFMCCF
ncbi:uncharacterized protein LOC106714560 isoform X1 [Papilio machaon]|uniref:uncharacterized protein LOC106714560 isoform X1 n=1 Tax=Papilio machaon TaxID=76193 RepID=UPI001E664A10|nr:uncharacterized protein LOC106714560 isoform X1 [Papilio machaon]